MLKKIKGEPCEKKQFSLKFFVMQILVYSENSFFELKKHFFHIRLKNKFLWIEESFVDSKKFFLMWTNLFLWIKENFYWINKAFFNSKKIFFELTKLSLIQRNFFFGRISKKNFFDSKKLFSLCSFQATDRKSRGMILSVVFCERKNNTFNNVFVIEFFLTVAFYQFFENDLIFMNHGLFFGKKYFLQLCCFQFWVSSFQWLK